MKILNTKKKPPEFELFDAPKSPPPWLRILSKDGKTVGSRYHGIGPYGPGIIRRVMGPKGSPTK